MSLGAPRAQDEDEADGNSLTADGEASMSKSVEEREGQAPEPVDLLMGMPEADNWGIKGLRTLMNNHQDYHAMIVGLDPQSLGLDVSSPEYVVLV